MKDDRVYLILVGGLLLGLIAFLLLQPEKISWDPTYTKRKTEPFADRALYERLDDIFPGQPVETLYVPAYEFAKTRDSADTGINYLLIRGNAHFDDFDVRALCEMAAAGNHIFLTGETIGGKLADTLRIQTEFQAWEGQDIFADPDTIRLNFTDTALYNSQGYGMRPGENSRFVSIPDSVKDVEPLSLNSRGNPVLVRKQFGRGAIYFHCVPLAFTNYYLLRGQHAGYIARCFSYLPVAPVYWDEFYKVGRLESATPIRVLLQQPALKLAWVMLLVFVGLFLLFQSKRRQRIIPVIKPFENSTLQFVGTVARLYYNRGDHTVLAKKKVTYFLERLRTRYQLPIELLNEESIKAVSDRTGVDLALTKAVLGHTHHIQTATHITEKELIAYNARVEEFWQKAN